MAWCGATESMARMTSRGVKSWPSETRRGGRIASASVSMPQSPHPVGPANRLRRVPKAAARGADSHIRNSIPTSSSMISSRSISSIEETLPSVRLKPSANSSRSCGVAIITA
jgi:hypothetical protein